VDQNWYIVSPGSANTFSIVLTQQYLCQKLPKSVNVRWSYSVQRQCRYFETLFRWGYDWRTTG